MSDQWTLLCGFFEPLTTSKEELLRDLTTNDGGFERVLTFNWSHVTGNFSELTSTTGLFLVRIVEISWDGDGFTVRDLWLTSDTFNTVLSLHSFDVDLQMQLTHTGDDGLLGLRVVLHSESRIFLLETVDGLGEVGGVLRFGSDGQRDDGVWNEHRGHGDLRSTIGESITRGTVDTENLDLLPGLDVGNEPTLLDLTLVHTQVGQLTVLTFFQLERQGDKRFLGRWDQLDWGLVLLDVETFVQDLRRIWQVIDNSVQDWLDSLVGQGGTHQHRGELSSDGGSSDGVLDLLDGWFLFVQHSQGSFNFDGEINVAWSVNQVEMIVGVVLVPGTVGGGRLNSDTLFSFQIHGIHLGTNTISTTNIMNGFNSTSVKQHSFGECGLTGINVGRDTNVSHTLGGGNIFSWQGGKDLINDRFFFIV
ncbi:hypothetical protein WICPIJ_008374 [Wickerhamomyces pijperi]|uniref:Uncharacterized protein n=1 Tax=Wickerhamomyces pijperi TaxID=599730 RepID=A0A9P8TIK7_WICPI|nr:hypothetical protein WICPIJ_008374 [Wickerhamomyces pijperi]